MISRASAIDFPFGRDKARGLKEAPSYTLAELKRYERKLSAWRENDRELSNELRAAGRGSPRWIKFRNEELVPLLYFAAHIRAPDDSLFRVVPEHNDTDVELNIAGVIENLQITVAYPDWAAAGVTQPDQTAGRYHRLQTEILNRDGGVGIGPIVKREGKFLQEPRMVSTPELIAAHKEGLQAVLAKKITKAYSVRSLSLLVHAVGCREMLSPERFRNVVQSAFSAARAAVRKEIHFSEIYILDSDDGYFVDLQHTVK
jgi:hypothetical protein